MIMNPSSPVAATIAMSALFCFGPNAQEPQPSGRAPDSLAPQEPRKFLPSDYDFEVFVDVDALLDTGLFDVLERSFVRPLIESFARSHGFYLSDVHTYRSAQRRTVDENGWLDTVSVSVFEGSEKVGLSHVDLERLGNGFEARRLGGVDVVTDPGVKTLVSPRAGSLVEGDASVVDPTLLGKRIGGVPVPDLLALTAGPGDIAFVAGMTQSEFERAGELSPIPSEWFDPADPPRAIMLRLSRDGDGLRLEARVRFRDGNIGPARLQRNLDEWLKSLGQDPRLRALSPTLRKTKTSIDHADLVATLGIDRPERIFSVATNASGSLLFLALSSAGVVQVAPQAAPGPAPAPVKPPESKPDRQPEPVPLDAPR